MLDFAFNGGDAAVHMRGALQVIPEALRVHFLFQLGQLVFQIVQMQPAGNFLELGA